MRLRNLLLVTVLSLSGVSTARAQHQFEITPFFGGKYGGIIDFSQSGNPNVDYYRLKNSEDYGVIAGITFWDSFGGEFMWNRQPTSLTAHNPNNGTFTYLTKLNLDMYQFSVLYQFRDREAKLKPFFVSGLGFSHFGGMQQVNGQNVLPFYNRFSYNLGGGVKYFFSPHFGIRFDTRWSPTNTTQGIGQYCSYTCYSLAVANKAQQGQSNIGLDFRF